MTNILKDKVMKRVKTVYYIKTVLNSLLLKIAILIPAVVAFGGLVHVAAIFRNMPQINDVYSLFNFSYYAFVNTEVVVQGVTIFLGVVTLWLVRDTIKKIPTLHIGFSHA
jgi:hypothetical protein